MKFGCGNDSVLDEEGNAVISNPFWRRKCIFIPQVNINCNRIFLASRLVFEDL
jgi:hypothetical protein